jgi:hypothetical protein
VTSLASWLVTAMSGKAAARLGEQDRNGRAVGVCAEIRDCQIVATVVVEVRRRRVRGPIADREGRPRRRCVAAAGLPSSTVTSSESSAGAARPGRPSPLKSPTATANVVAPAG